LIFPYMIKPLFDCNEVGMLIYILKISGPSLDVIFFLYKAFTALYAITI
jgi:hypothetical protein